ncbi:hypothetical protein H8959_006712, partial [Pygathrix nigripes]
PTSGTAGITRRQRIPGGGGRICARGHHERSSRGPEPPAAGGAGQARNFDLQKSEDVLRRGSQSNRYRAQLAQAPGPASAGRTPDSDAKARKEPTVITALLSLSEP